MKMINLLFIFYSILLCNYVCPMPSTQEKIPIKINQISNPVINQKDDGLMNLELEIEKRKIEIILWPNRNLLSKNTIIDYVTEDNQNNRATKLGETFENANSCYYHGTVRDIQDSSVAVSICEGLVKIFYKNFS